jgi:hypothetical protein
MGSEQRAGQYQQHPEPNKSLSGAGPAAPDTPSPRPEQRPHGKRVNNPELQPLQGGGGKALEGEEPDKPHEQSNEGIDELMQEIRDWRDPRRPIPGSFVFGPPFPVSARHRRKRNHRTSQEET